jgi:hypothetical protein
MNGILDFVTGGGQYADPGKPARHSAESAPTFTTQRSDA